MNIRKMPTIPTLPKKKKVAAYARVSSGKDTMLHSLSAQISYYSEYIQKQPEWLYCGVYVDEAVTGTKSERPEFQRLLSDCRAGKIDMIVTKSISRFARNTVTLLETVRELKARGIDVYFEEPNIHTMSAAGEMMLTLLASVAQEESRAVSENMKWRVRNNFENGLPWNGTVLGYRIVNGQYVVVPHEAEIVRNIFDMYQSGMGVNKIIQSLNDTGLRTRKGCAWGKCAVMSCLRNYAYTGNLLLQKTYRQDHISKQFCFNRGELPMYHAEGTHEPIIAMEQFEAVQRRLSRQADKHAHPGVTPKRYPFSGKIVCAVCGKKYRRKVTATGPVWICSTYNNKGKQYCASKQISEDTLCRMTAAVLRMRTFDAGAFQDRVKSIDAEPGNTLRFRLFDGTESVIRWQDKSRRDSWTPEMKEKAREKYYGSRNQNTGYEEQIHVGAGVADA